MNRQAFIKQLGLGGGIALLSPTLFSSCKTDDYSLSFLTKAEYLLVEELSEIILPASDQSPGAKDAKVAQFVDSLVTNCYAADRQSILRADIGSIQQHTVEQFNQVFYELDHQDKMTCVTQLEAAANESYFRLKPLLLFAYFSSEQGITEARRYVAVPGSYDGDIKYTFGDRAWGL